MILVERLLYKLDQRLDKLSTSEHQQIPVEDKLLALNEAQIVLIKKKLSGNNIYKLGLDGFKKRYQDLQFLIEPFEEHKLEPKLVNKQLNKYSVSLVEETPKFMFYLDSYLVCSKGVCKNRIVYCNTDLVKHADITILLQNNNYKPSFEYQETLSDISSNSLDVYTDGTFSIDGLYLSYIRYPKEISIEGEEDFQGNATERQDCELEEYLEDELLDLTTLSLAISTENPNAVQGSQLRIENNE